MTREELEHIIRASGDITDQYEFVIVGSQSILGAVPRPEDVFTVSMEADRPSTCRWSHRKSCRSFPWAAEARRMRPGLPRLARAEVLAAVKCSATRRLGARVCWQDGCLRHPR